MTTNQGPDLPGRYPFARLIRLPEVCGMTGLSRSAVYRGVAAGTFPVPVKVGERASAWHAGEVSNWVAARLAERDAKGAA